VVMTITAHRVVALALESAGLNGPTEPNGPAEPAGPAGPAPTSASGTDPAWFGIAEVAELSGLSQDTLRWYERQGLIPPVERGADGRRRFSPRALAMVVMLAKLRATGMPTEQMRGFAGLLAGGAATHGRRLAILEEQRSRIHQRMAVLAEGLAVLDEKAEHYRALISAGLDCDGLPVSTQVARRQQGGVPR
jgi:DNA-binding transcriptional MerR regulator